jgi:hypothetical protein
MLRHVWSIFARSGSIWVAWVRENLLKRKSFWSVGIPQSCSWSWRKILKLRDVAKRFLKFEVGNGENIQMWLDSWHPSGILLETFGQRVVYDAHSIAEAKLSSVILNGDWFWTPTRFEAFVEIQSRLSELNLGVHYKAIWSASNKGCYVSSDTWQILGNKKMEIDWRKLAWFPLAIPEQAFILRLFMQGRLLTGDRLIKMEYKGNFQCVYCHNQIESREHLFFECSFSYRIWKFFKSRCDVISPSIKWDEIIQMGISKWENKNLKGIICRDWC